MDINTKKIAFLIIGVISIIVLIFTIAYYFRPGNLIITTEYSEMKYKVDDQYINKTIDVSDGSGVIELELKRGPHTVQAINPNNDKVYFSQTVRIKSNQTNIVEVSISKEDKEELLESAPTD